MILHLTRDLGVNLAGVEIILNMREKMAEMQRQIEEFVSSLNTEITPAGAPGGAGKLYFADPGDRNQTREEARVAYLVRCTPK